MIVQMFRALSTFINSYSPFNISALVTFCLVNDLVASSRAYLNILNSKRNPKLAIHELDRYKIQ